MKHLKRHLLATFGFTIALALSLTACGGGGNADELTLSGKYARGGILRVGTDASWAALGQAEYQTDGTGTLSYSHSAFGPVEGLSITYGLDSFGTLLETITMPGAAGETSNGAVTDDKKVMAVIDDDLEDGLRGLEVGIRLSSGSVNPTGDYFHVGFYSMATGNVSIATSSVATFNGDGTGSELYIDSDGGSAVRSPFTYVVGDEGRLTVQYTTPGRESLNIVGTATSDKSVLSFVDNDAAEGIVGIEVSIRKSSGMNVSSLNGKYHFFINGAYNGGSADTAVVEFDGAGGAMIYGLGTGDYSATYTVAEDGAFSMTSSLIYETVTWIGGVREGGSMFAAADIVQGRSVGIIVGIAQW